MQVQQQDLCFCLYLYMFCMSCCACGLLGIKHINNHLSTGMDMQYLNYVVEHKGNDIANNVLGIEKIKL